MTGRVGLPRSIVGVPRTVRSIMYMYPLRMYLTCRRVSYIVIVIPCPRRNHGGRAWTWAGRDGRREQDRGARAMQESDVGQQDNLEREREKSSTQHNATR